MGSRGEKVRKAEGQGKTILLMGNLNVGKTVLFNWLCGKRLRVANYAGTSVSIGRGTFTEGGVGFGVVDTPGINNLIPQSEDEIISRDILIAERPDIIAQIADGKNLRRSLLLTLQLAEYGVPMLLDVNMMDEARQRGIRIDMQKLSGMLGVPVTGTVATEGEGVRAFEKALPGATVPRIRVEYPEPVETALSAISKMTQDSHLASRAVGTALLAGDEGMKRWVIKEYGSDFAKQIETAVSAAQAHIHHRLGTVILRARLRAADRIVAAVQAISPPLRPPLSEKLGEWSRRLSTGIPIAAVVVVLMYLFVGKLGAQVLVNLFEDKVFGDGLVPLARKLACGIPSQFVQEALVGDFGLVSVGLKLAFGIVLPVMVTFFFAFAILEDSGYLPRLSILSDRVLRKIGLNGKAVLPLAVGFSCTTMAILTTRVLDTKRERYIATLLMVLGIPCAPLLSMMLVLLAGMSVWASVVVAGVLLAQVTVIGYLAGKMLKGPPSDFVLELPPIRVPKLKSLLQKTGWRVWWFTKEVIPFFLLATFALFILDRFGMLRVIEKVGKPILTDFVGLPAESIKVMIMTLFRRESGAALLKELSDAGKFDRVQVVVALLVITCLSPCVNTVIVIVKERGLKATLSILGFVMPYALVVGAVVNWLCRTLGVTFR